MFEKPEKPKLKNKTDRVPWFAEEIDKLSNHELCYMLKDFSSIGHCQDLTPEITMAWEELKKRGLSRDELEFLLKILPAESFSEKEVPIGKNALVENPIVTEAKGLLQKINS